MLEIFSKAKGCFLLLLFCWPLIISAQSIKRQNKVGIFVAPGFSNRIMASNSNDPICDGCSQNYTQLVDSLNSVDGNRTTTGFGLSFGFTLKKRTEIQTGLTFLDVGFRRSYDDLEFNAVLHPELGRIGEVSNTDKSIDYNHRFQYLSLPVWFNFNLKRNPRFIPELDYYFTAGVNFNLLLNHDIEADLTGFTVRSSQRHLLDSTGLKASSFNTSITLGARFDYDYYKAFGITLQPIFQLALTSVSTNELKVRPFGIGAQIGIYYRLDQEKSKD